MEGCVTLKENIIHDWKPKVYLGYCDYIFASKDRCITLHIEDLLGVFIG